MGMTIEEAMKRFRDKNIILIDEDFVLYYTAKKYLKMQADYENRLKADMAAMLTELKNQIIDKSWNIDMYDDDLDFECCYMSDIDSAIQEKINELKEQEDGN